MEVEDEVESRKKLDEQRKRLQRQLRELEKFTCMPQDMQSKLKDDWQQQLQEIEQRRNDLLLEHQRAQKRSQKIQSIQHKKKHVQKETAAAGKEMRKIREDITLKEERFRLLSDMVGRRRKKRQQRVANSRLLLGDDVGADSRLGSE